MMWSVRKRAALMIAGFVALAVLVGLQFSPPNAHGAGDPPRLVPWRGIGDIALGEPQSRMESEYGSEGHGFHVLQRYGDNVQGYYRLRRRPS
jgi:hypothetical protein